MWVGNRKEILEVPCQGYEGRTYIPIAAISKAFGKEVFYDRGLIIISDIKNIYNPAADKTILDGIISRINNLPSVNSIENLKKLLAGKGLSNTGILYEDMTNGNALTEAQPRNSASVSAEKQQAVSDYSNTNVQVEGVDESDIIKTDGKYIYYLNNEMVQIIEAYPADKMKLVGKVDYSDSDFAPSELYIYNDKMIVIGNEYGNTKDKAVEKSMPYYRVRSSETVVRIYNLTDRTKPTLIRESALGGSYLSSRMLGSSLYLVPNLPGYYYANQSDKELLPFYRDSIITGGKTKIIDPDKIRYVPDFKTSDYIMMVGLDVDDSSKNMNVLSYLGTGNNIYVSDQNLYIALTNYSSSPIMPMATANSAMIRVGSYQSNTDIYKFSLNKGNITFLSKGNVPGTIINQFSMDEYGQYFRIATTKGEIWQTGENASQNNLYILDATMNIAGRLEGLAPGEKIYSVRFMGDRAYIVTFKAVDPLFVIDVKEPSNPTILGALKIPGYSDYLHPYDQNHIIGFGKDTININGNAYYQGIKMAMFDVTDVATPKQHFVEKIGDRGTYSELLSNHKALMYSSEKGIMSFPVTLMEVSADQTKIKNDYDLLQYGQFKFQGAYVYGVDLLKGFTLKGRITHMSDQDYLKSGYYGSCSDKYVERSLYIGNTLYTVSKQLIMANDMGSMKEIGNLKLR